MSELNPAMNPDPVAKLAKFTPAGGPDAAELLFAAGRASARTHWGWKAAVAALLLSNAALGAVVAFGQREPLPALPAPAPAVPPQPVAPTPPAAPPAPASAPSEEPWSYRLLRNLDVNQMPKGAPVENLSPARAPLSVLDGRDGELD